ncbi:MAG: hypothetical protein HZC40_01440 [Chloroflexi bacterium]|nr:hypothetical protein [Chloroflexota bacterium]
MARQNGGAIYSPAK